MNKNLILYVLSAFLIACSGNQAEDDKDNENDIHGLIENFSTGLKDNDSVFIDIRLSSDLDHGFASVVLSKEKNQLFLNTWLATENQTKKLGKVKYSFSNDTLSFESICKYMSGNENSDKKSSVVFTVKYKGDSLNFYSLDHINHMKNVGYFYSLFYKYYPNEPEFQPVFPPSE